MIEIRTDVRRDLNDLDNVSNLLNYALEATINKHYQTDNMEEKKKTAKDLMINYLIGKKNVISNVPCPIVYSTDSANGINGMRDLINNIKPETIRYSILKQNILSYAYTEYGKKKSDGYDAKKATSKAVTNLISSGNLNNNIDLLFDNLNILNNMITNYIDISFNNDFSIQPTALSLAIGPDKITSKALEQIDLEHINLEQSLNKFMKH